MDLTPEGHEAAAKTGAIISERNRQKAEEGWTLEHDREHSHGELLRAALAYLAGDASWWPWDGQPKFGPRDHVKAGALVIAELDRLGVEEREAAVRDYAPEVAR